MPGRFALYVSICRVWPCSIWWILRFAAGPQSSRWRMSRTSPGDHLVHPARVEINAVVSWRRMSRILGLPRRAAQEGPERRDDDSGGDDHREHDEQAQDEAENDRQHKSEAQQQQDGAADAARRGPVTHVATSLGTSMPGDETESQVNCQGRGQRGRPPCVIKANSLSAIGAGASDRQRERLVAAVAERGYKLVAAVTELTITHNSTAARRGT